MDGATEARPERGGETRAVGAGTIRSGKKNWKDLREAFAQHWDNTS